MRPLVFTRSRGRESVRQNENKEAMKKFLMICMMLVTIVVTAFAQKVDYSQYNVVAQKGNVTILEKEGKGYRMVVGSLKKSQKVYMLGHNKDLASGRFDRLLEIMANNKIPKDGRLEMFCGTQIRVFAEGEGDKRQFTFKDEDTKTNFHIQ